MSYEQNKRADERNLSVKADNTVLTHSNYADQKCIHFQKFHTVMISKTVCIICKNKLVTLAHNYDAILSAFDIKMLDNSTIYTL